jgi:hypothetical protein
MRFSHLLEWIPSVDDGSNGALFDQLSNAIEALRGYPYGTIWPFLAGLD